MAIISGRAVANNMRGNYQPDWGLNGETAGFFIINITGDIQILPPVNRKDGGIWYLMINSPGPYSFLFDSSYIGYETQGGVEGTYVMQLATDSDKHYVLSTKVFNPPQQLKAAKAKAK